MTDQENIDKLVEQVLLEDRLARAGRAREMERIRKEIDPKKARKIQRQGSRKLVRVRMKFYRAELKWIARLAENQGLTVKEYILRKVFGNAYACKKKRRVRADRDSERGRRSLGSKDISSQGDARI